MMGFIADFVIRFLLVYGVLALTEDVWSRFFSE
jgi:hypothetical protein